MKLQAAAKRISAYVCDDKNVAVCGFTVRHDELREPNRPALLLLVALLAGSKLLAKSRLVFSRPSLSSGITMVAFSLHRYTHTDSE